MSAVKKPRLRTPRTLGLARGWVVVLETADGLESLEFLSSSGGWFHSRKDAENQLEEKRKLIERYPHEKASWRPVRVAYIHVQEIPPPAEEGLAGASDVGDRSAP